MGIIEKTTTEGVLDMSTAPAGPPALLTVEEFSARPDPGCPEELVRGRIVSMPPPKPRHGEICANVVAAFVTHVKRCDLGRVLSNDSGVITERGPDTVRGADVSVYTYGRVPKGSLPNRYLEAVPDLIVEVLSPDDRWPKVLQKIAEYLGAGTSVVIVLDDERKLAHLYRADGATRILPSDEVLTIPDVLPDFAVRVGELLE
jgi:Uma2 family endonuclease